MNWTKARSVLVREMGAFATAAILVAFLVAILVAFLVAIFVAILVAIQNSSHSKHRLTPRARLVQSRSVLSWLHNPVMHDIVDNRTVIIQSGK